MTSAEQLTAAIEQFRKDAYAAGVASVTAAKPLLKALLPPGCKIMGHEMMWFQPGTSHSNNTGVPYDSSSPTTLASKVKLWTAAGMDGVIVDWYHNPHDTTGFANLLKALEGTSLKAGISIDKGAAGIKGSANPTQGFMDNLNFVIQNYANHPNFFRDFICDFGDRAAGVNFATVRAAFPSWKFVHDTSGDGPFYTWGPDKLPSSTQAKYADPNCIMGSVSFRFFDGSPADLNKSIWGKRSNGDDSVRQMNRDNLGDNFVQGVRGIPAGMKYVQLVTMNDYEEGSGIEGILSAVLGIPIL